ncbi:hypothetical protein BGZ99_003435 [Dissophora globulifera]|uniref:HECT-type E3 ubiquitin transferase n=1 Tax=Dissophora globulifera TaxID=979702 RepID=A0A9P6RKD1_9FUNG|nr:hypothetical protein BGZ99_003435 [Dissophora globulifera]
MFDGNFKSKRTINLGGNKQQIDKQKLLRQAQEERRVREAERVRLKAAEHIQAWYRGRKVAIDVRQGLRTSWDQDTGSLYQSIQSSAQSIDQLSQSVETAVKQFLIFFRPECDHQRLVLLCNLLLLLPVGDAGARLVIIPFQRAEDLRSEWVVRLRRLLPVLLRHLGSRLYWTEEESAPTLSLLDTLTVSESFQSVQNLALANSLSKGFLQTLSGSAALAQLALFLTRIPIEEKSRPSIAKALLLSLRICKAADHTQEYSQVLDQFITQIMAVPLLPNRMSIETLTAFTSRLPLDAILQHLSATSCSTVAILSQYRITPLVANVLAFGYQRVSKMSPTVSNAYLRVLTTLLGVIPQDSVELPPKGPDADDDEDMEDIEWRSEVLPGASPTLPNPSASTTKLDRRITKWLSIAYDSHHLNDILGSVEPSTTALSSSGSHEILSTESVGEITQLLLNLITLFPSHKIGILSSLMYFRFGSKAKQTSGSSSGGGKFFGISIIKIFLDAFMSTTLYDQLVRSMRQDTPLSVQLVLDPGHEKAWSLLAFVSELYCQILVTMGDDEFHDEARNPISLPSVITLASVARDVAFLLWWNDNALNMDANMGGSKNLRVGYLRDIVTKLTRQLHARDSRKAFCPKDHWLLSMPLDMSAFKRAAIQDEQSLSHDQDLEENEGEDADMTSTDYVRTRRAINRRQRSSLVARLSPRLGVLNNIPFVIRFEDRVAIFRAFVESDRQRTPWMSGFHPHAIGEARVRRDNVFEDGYEQLNSLGPQLKGRIAISFIDRYGIPEAGIDGGGVFKEFLTSLVHQAFDTNYGLFMNTTEQLLYPNPHRFAQEKTQLKHYEFLGRILGKALYEGILIDAAFAGFFLAKCLGQVNYLDDLPSLDPELYRGLMFLKNYDGNVEDLSLNFTVDDEELGQPISRELIPNGSNIPVTRENRIRYIYLTAHYRLNTQIDRQCKAFFRGLSDLIDAKWLWMFNQQELQVMLGGAQTAISLKDLEQNVVYSNFERTDPTIEHFWSVVQEMDDEERRLLVKFVTSCARPPLLGFAELNPKLCIRNAGQEEDRLPTSSTCMNLLKLPAFTSRQRLKEKLLYAIHSEAGFDLS